MYDNNKYMKINCFPLFLYATEILALFTIFHSAFPFDCYSYEYIVFFTLTNI